MRSYRNIDKNAFRKGEYVGYAPVNGTATVWKIARDGRNGWKATVSNSTERHVYQNTGIYQLVGANLQVISEKLSGLNSLVSL